MEEREAESCEQQRRSRQCSKGGSVSARQEVDRRAVGGRHNQTAGAQEADEESHEAEVVDQ